MDNFNDCVLRDCDAELKAVNTDVNMVDTQIFTINLQDSKQELIPMSVFCGNCPFNDGMVYTSDPPQYKCTKTNKWHLGNYGCGKVYMKSEYVYMGEDNG